MYYTALIFGLLGSFHCVGMCGPIAFLLPLDRQSSSKRIFQVVSYHAGRLTSYAILGFLLGWVGKGLSLFGIQQYLSIAVGVLMIAVVVMPTAVMQRFSITKPVYHLIGKVKSNLGTQLKKRDPGTFYTIGFLNGWLPCGLVYMAIFGAMATGVSWQGGFYMILFGLGTIPLMTTAIYLGNFINAKVKTKILKLIPIVVLIVGILFVLRGLGLGIPYVSPAYEVSQPLVSAQNSCH